MFRRLPRRAVRAVEDAVDAIVSRDLTRATPMLREGFSEAPGDFWEAVDLYNEDEPVRLVAPPGPFRRWDTDVTWTVIPGLVHVAIPMWSTEGETDLTLETHLHDTKGSAPRVELLNLHVL